MELPPPYDYALSDDDTLEVLHRELSREFSRTRRFPPELSEISGNPRLRKPVAMIRKWDGSMHPYKEGKYYNPDAWEPVYAKNKPEEDTANG